MKKMSSLSYSSLKPPIVTMYNTKYYANSYISVAVSFMSKMKILTIDVTIDMDVMGRGASAPS